MTKDRLKNEKTEKPKKEKKETKNDNNGESIKPLSSKKAVALVDELASELLKLAGSKASVEVSSDKENDAIAVDIKTDEEAGLLIGNRGETLSSIQAILGMMFRKRTGQWQRIIVNVADWREKQETRLNSLAEQTAERVLSSGDEQTLYNLNASQRRIVHLALSENKKVETESQGEGRERCLVVRPKSKKKE